MSNKDKIILDLCGGTGAWSKPYKNAGYIVYNITLPRYDVTAAEFYKEYILFKSISLIDDDLKLYYKKIYGILAAPPCTRFSFARTNANRPRHLEEGMKNVIACLNIIWHCQYNIEDQNKKMPPLKFWALENPVAMLKWFLGEPALIFDPYEYAFNKNELYKKKTAIWGYFNVPKKNKLNKAGYGKFDNLKMEEIKKIRSMHESAMWNSSRKILRSVTPAGFADAFYEANK